jgi:medium-chain acyl-[acyl-carrier-protein] hydrolase
MQPHTVTSSTAFSPASWVRSPAPRPGARLRLICFHPAGGGPSMFRPWPARLPADVEVLAVQLPGRESRFTETPLSDYREAVSQAFAALRPLLDQPYALFGHSMGALLAYGVAVAAQRAGAPAPTRLIVSSACAPGTRNDKPGRGHWPDAELLDELREMGGTPEEVLTDPDLVSLILPTLRADYRICDSFSYPADLLLDCPVSAFCGSQDTVTAEQMRGWSATSRVSPRTGAEAEARVFPGSHFYLTGPTAPVVLEAVSALLG